MLIAMKIVEEKQSCSGKFASQSGFGLFPRLLAVAVSLVLALSLCLVPVGSEAFAADKSAKTKSVKKTQSTTKVSKASYTVKKSSMTGNAKKIYSVLKAAKIPDVNIAGVLANWEAESYIDPTAIECIYTEQYYIGKAKKKALSNMSAHARRCFSMYAASGISLNHSAYKRANGKSWPGIGLGMFTGRSIDPLMDWAKKVNLPWYSLECQVSYSINGYKNAKWLAGWKKAESSPSAAARVFLRKWENSYSAGGNRAQKAEKWYKKIKSWKPDLEYGKQVLALGNPKLAKTGKAKVAKTVKIVGKAAKAESRK